MICKQFLMSFHILHEEANNMILGLGMALNRYFSSRFLEDPTFILRIPNREGKIR
jgi:hypothetical protein